MPAATDRIEFAPPPPPGRARAFALAVLAHVLLMLALTWGITWNRESQDMSVEAELWASVPQEAAPRAVQPEPSPPVVQAPPLPAPPPDPPEPKVEAPPPPAPAPAPEPDIAVEREKRRQEEAERRRAELEEQKKLEARKRQEELEREKKLTEARRKKEELEKRELAERKAAAEKKKQEEVAKAKAQEQQEAKLRETIREQQMDRMRGLASGTGGEGTAARSAGPTDSYAGRIRARVRPNIVFTDDIPGNPTAEIEVRMALDGTITSKRVVKSSGVRSWDEAVLRALDKTAVLPRDIDGRVHSPLIIEFRPKG